MALLLSVRVDGAVATGRMAHPQRPQNLPLAWAPHWGQNTSNSIAITLKNKLRRMASELKLTAFDMSWFSAQTVGDY
jgi:hypothetical protein